MDSPMPLEKAELTSRLNEILQRIAMVNDETEEEEIRVLKERIRFEVTTNPVILRCTSTYIYAAGSTLLSFICDYNHFDDDSFIKFLIESDPSALLLPDNGSKVINIISSSSLCVLMPWIAATYPWVLHHGPGIQSMFDLIKRFASREDTPECTAAIIKQFFEAYPQALVQEDDEENTPLHKILRFGRGCCDVDLVKWIAEQCPSNMLKRNLSGMTPLHIVCLRLGLRKEDNMSIICRYLITYCPRSIQSSTEKGNLPIHLLLMHDSSHQVHPLFRDIIVRLLREYPESYRKSFGDTPSDIRAPNSYAFIRHIKPLLDEEKELMESANQLRLMSIGSEETPGTLSTAVECTSDELMRSTANVFNSWATSFVQVLDNKVEDISNQLDHACIDFDDNDTAGAE